MSTDPTDDEYMLSLVDTGPSDEDPYDAAIIALDQVRDELDRRREAERTHRPGLRTFTRGQLAALPQPEPLIEDTIDLRTVALLAGGWGTLKSFIALDWSACIATGKAWQGRPVEQGRVLYVSAEGAHGLHARLTAWETGWRRTIPDEALTFVPDPVNLTDNARVEQLAELAAGCALVVIDTFARCMVGADENSARDVGLGVDALYRIRAATVDGTVLVVHHTGKDRTTVRGSSALEAGVDTAYLTEGDARLVQLTRTKRKDGPRDDQLKLGLRLVDGTGSGAIESVQPTLDNAESADKLLSTFVSTFGNRSASKAELRAVAGMPSASFHRGLTSLVKAGLLIETNPGRLASYTLAEEAEQ